MKLSNYLLLACLGVANHASAQTPTPTNSSDNGLYVRLGVGYSFTHAGQTSILGGIPLKGSSSSGTGSMTQSVKKGSLGAGFGVCLAGGYMISRHVGLELAIDATVGPKKYKYTETDLSGGPDINNYTIYAKHPIYIVPGVLLTTGGNGLNFYTRLGLALPISDKVIIKDDETNTAGIATHVYHYEYELTHRFNLGITGAAGVSYPISDMIILWAEVNGISRNAFTKKIEMTAYTDNGVDRLGSQTTNQKVTEFDFDASATSGTPVPSEPSKGISSSVPFSNIGLTVGVRIGL